MGQTECLQVISTEKYELSKEIAERLNQRPGIVSLSLTKLYHQGLIFRKSVKEDGHRMYRWMKK